MSSSETLQAIFQNPTSDRLKLQYAHELRAADDPRGDLILLQLEQESDEIRDKSQGRIDSLLATHHTRWCDGLNIPLDRCIYRKGFIEELDLAYCGLSIGTVRELFRWPYISLINKVSVEGNCFGDAVIDAIGEGVQPLHLHSLNLAANSITSLGASRLSSTHGLSHLVTLYLDENELYDDGIVFIANSPIFSNLTYLGLSCTGIDDVGIKAILTSPYLTQLVALDLRQTEISEWAHDSLRGRFGEGLLF